ncbi:FAD-dependent oxidoreductase [Legionella bozemanae]|uniref:FAD-dependent oxidoreductase n=1 Tax=Legionella bozemanae TaxID=447 RepID=UPI00399CF157
MKHVHQVITNIAEHDLVQRFENLGVKVIKASGKFLSTNTLQIAAGSSPLIPSILGLDKVSYLTNETIFSIKEKPKHLIVIGGGPIYGLVLLFFLLVYLPYW